MITGTEQIGGYPCISMGNLNKLLPCVVKGDDLLQAGFVPYFRKGPGIWWSKDQVPEICKWLKDKIDEVSKAAA